MKAMPNNTGKVTNRYTRGPGSTTVTLNFRALEATSLRSFVDSVRLRGDKMSAPIEI